MHDNSRAVRGNHERSSGQPWWLAEALDIMPGSADVRRARQYTRSENGSAVTLPLDDARWSLRMRSCLTLLSGRDNFCNAIDNHTQGTTLLTPCEVLCMVPPDKSTLLHDHSFWQSVGSP